MSFSYDASVATAKDQFRLLTTDTNGSDYIFSDEEISMFLTMNAQDPQMAAAQGIRTIAVNKAKIAIFYRINGFNGFELDRRDAPKLLLEAAKALEESAKQTPWEIISVLDFAVGRDGIDRSQYDVDHSEHFE
jgi:hypothetical protein